MLTGGEAKGPTAEGSFFQPTVLANVDTSMDCYHQVCVCTCVLLPVALSCDGVPLCGAPSRSCLALWQPCIASVRRRRQLLWPMMPLLALLATSTHKT